MIPTALTIMNEVAEAYGVTLDDLRSKSRVARLATARAVACYLMYRHLNMSTTEVGRSVFRDRTTVMHCCRQVEGFYLWPKMYATDLAIINSIKQKYFSDGNDEHQRTAEPK